MYPCTSLFKGKRPHDTSALRFGVFGQGSVRVWDVCGSRLLRSIGTAQPVEPCDTPEAQPQQSELVEEKPQVVKVEERPQVVEVEEHPQVVEELPQVVEEPQAEVEAQFLNLPQEEAMTTEKPEQYIVEEEQPADQELEVEKVRHVAGYPVTRLSPPSTPSRLSNLPALFHIFPPLPDNPQVLRPIGPP
eukprot:5503716-Pyramimonas_sp.AAC.1